MLARVASGIAGLILSAAVFAQAAPEEGLDYYELRPPQATESAGKIEVVEFFWYRCPHCYALEPDLEDWLKRLPADVAFKRVPGILDQDWAIDARIFFTLEAMNELKRLHRPLFDAIHRDGASRLQGEAYANWVADWLTKQGVDSAKYDATLRSFTVDSKVRRAAQMSRAYKVSGVPTLAVQGRFVVLSSSTRGKMFATTDALIAALRKPSARGGS